MRFAFNEILFIVAVVIPTVWALFDVLQTPTDVWESSRQNQLLWAAVVFLIPILGPALYYVLARPRIKEVS